MREINIMSGLVANETKLKKFYQKYDKTVDFYYDKYRKRNNIYCGLFGFSNLVFMTSLGSLLLQTADPTARNNGSIICKNVY